MYRTKTEAALAEAEKAHADEPERAELLRRARRFKASWVELAEALTDAKRGRRWREWGYESFESYAKNELKLRQETVRAGLHLPFLASVQAGERHRSGKQRQRTALGIIDLHIGGEREGGHLAAKIAGQLEVRQGDAAGGRGLAFRRRWRDSAARGGEKPQGAKRSADFQSAVSPNCIRQGI